MKKFATMAISVALIGTMIAGGSLAYLQDSDSDVNVMTLGNVQIEQHEYERVVNADGTYATTDTFDGVNSYVLKDFTQGKPLLPSAINTTTWEGWDWDTTVVRMTQVDSYGGMQVFKAASNAQDKFVTVENTGKTDAYVRTLVAIEVGSTDGSLIGSSYHSTWDKNEIGKVNIDGNSYNVIEYVYAGGQLSDGTWRHENGVLPAGDTSYPNLSQVYIKSAATNEDMVAIDGNGNGTLDILVLSQAVQAQGFADAQTALKAAFGEANETNVQAWFTGEEFTAPTAVATAEELTAALTAGESVYLTEDVTVTATMDVAAGKDVEINLNGNNISYTVSNSGASAIINNKGTLDIVGKGTISFVADDPDLGVIPAYATNTITNTGTLTIGEGVTVTNGSEGGASYAVDNHGKFILDGGTLIGDRCALRVAKYNQDNVEFIMNSGTVTAKTPAWIQLPGSNAADAPKITVTINDGTFQSTKATSADNNVLYTYSYGNSHANTSITINGGEFLGGTVSIGSGYKVDAPTLKINGGTFEYDVLQWLANDSSTVLFAANN